MREQDSIKNPLKDDNNKLQKALNEFIESLKKSNKEFAET